MQGEYVSRLKTVQTAFETLRQQNEEQTKLLNKLLGIKEEDPEKVANEIAARMP